MHTPKRIAAIRPAASALRIVCAIMIAGTEGPAAGQQTPTAAPETAEPQQVVVTAEKRPENLTRVPMALTVLDDATLQRQHVREFADIVNLSPALTITYGTTPFNNAINMRGIGTTSVGIGVEADVAVILDDIPVGSQVMAFRDLVDIDRIEILKGPQSTLFGKNAVAGAVNIVSKPISGPVRGRMRLLYTSDGEWRAGVAYGGEVSDTFGYRVAGSDTRFPGNVDNLTYGSKVNGSGGKTFLARLHWRPVPALDIELSPRYDHTLVTCCALVATSFTPVSGALLSNIAQLPATSLFAGITPGPDNTALRNDYPTGQESTTRGSGLRIAYALPNGFTLSAISSLNRYYANDFRDQDFVDVPTLLYYPFANRRPAGVNAGYVQYGTFDVKSQTQEFRLVSSEQGSVRYVTGLWYGKNTIERHFVRGYSGIALTTPTQFFADTYNVSYAAYGQMTWAFQPHYSLIAGLRFNRETSGYGLNLGPPPPADYVPTGSFSSAGNTERSVTGKLGLQHEFGNAAMGYVTLSTGYKGLAYDLTSGLTAQVAAQQPVRSENSESYEAGLKSSFFEGKLTLNLAAFTTRFSNYQQNSGSYLPGTTTYVTRLNSIGGVRTRGLELDMLARPFARLSLNGRFAYTDAAITDFPNGPCYNVPVSPNGGFNAECRLKDPQYGGQNVQMLTGAPMPNAPRFKASIGGEYVLPARDGPVDWFVNANVNYQSKVLTNLNQDPTLAVPGHGIVDIGFGMTDKRGHYRLAFFIDNLLNRHYANTGFNTLGNWSARAPNPAVDVTTTTWAPARDAFRYAGVQFEAAF